MNEAPTHLVIDTIDGKQHVIPFDAEYHEQFFERFEQNTNDRVIYTPHGFIVASHIVRMAWVRQTNSLAEVKNAEQS